VANIICPACNRKQFNPFSAKCLGCGAQRRKDGTLVQIPNGYSLDEYGNFRSINKYRVEDGHIYVSFDYLLEEGKTTLRGEYAKLADHSQCVYPTRLSCNYGEGFERCEYMKYVNGRWECQATQA
jgi:hypothetical protein